MINFELSRNILGQLVCKTGEKIAENVVPLRAFPISAADDGISLITRDGKEIVWIPCLADLSESLRTMVEAELARREFMPEIESIQRISSFATPSTWYVKTNRGETSFILKGEENIRRVLSTSLLITDNHGVQFLIRDIRSLDGLSRKILDRFL